ncbi:DUF397 domain-containing protein [Streptomyces sp. NPDC059467]|uniref:DUF397 domain-containing protein n=1 Tax=Streptomyces sp. NPDC059467 TaxID=3346844 RepID=UPI0036B6FBD1
MSTDLHWSKSSDGEGECLEMAPTPTAIHIRDSKTTAAPTAPGPLTLTPAAWRAFLGSLENR